MNGEKSINGAYVVGHLSVVALGLMPKYSRVLGLLLALIYSLQSGLRFVGVVLLYQIKRPIGILLFGFISVIFLYLLTARFVGTDMYTALLGFRIAEPYYVLGELMDDPVRLLFGGGLGGELFEVKVGAKGYIIHSGRFHNYYLTIVYNFGVLGLFLFCYFIYSVYKKAGNIYGLLVLSSFLVMISIDGPRDGNWPIFLLCGVIVNEKIYRENINFM